MKKFAVIIIVLLVAGLWLMPVQRVDAQGEAARLEREMEWAKFQISGCQALIRYQFDLSPAEIEELKGCLVAAKNRLKELREKWLKLPPGPSARTPPKDPKSPPPSNEEEEKRKKLLGELIDVLEKRLVVLDEDAKRAMEEMELRMKAEKASKLGFNVKTESNGRLWTATFTTPEGGLVLKLPDDLRAGDTVSGTVIANPKGQTEDERAKNLEKLNRYQLMIANQTLTGPWGSFTWSWLNPTPDWLKPKAPFDQTFQPTGWALCPGQLMTCPQNTALFALLGTPYGGSGQVPFVPVAGTPVPERLITPPTESESHSTDKIEPPTLGQGGRDVEVVRRFNGDLKDTEIRIGRQPATILAESPRSCIFKSPEANFGLTEITIKENNVETKGSYRNIGVRLTAPKTSLMKGEKTTVIIEVSGLAGITKDVPLQLDAQGVVNMQDGNSQYLRIRPQDISSDGRFTTKRMITAQQAGVFSVIATVLNPRPSLVRLSEKLLQIRNAFGLSQTEMLKRLGLEASMKYSTISNYEFGIHEPPLSILLKYASVAGVTIDDLIDDELDLPEKLPSKPKQPK
jgi:DNA-binding XRE family transcriptional regulator